MKVVQFYRELAGFAAAFLPPQGKRQRYTMNYGTRSDRGMKRGERRGEGEREGRTLGRKEGRGELSWLDIPNKLANTAWYEITTSRQFYTPPTFTTSSQD